MFFLRFCHFLHQRYKLCKIIFNRCPFRFDPKKKTLPIAANAWKKNTMNNVHEWNFKTKKNTFRFIYFQKHCIKRFHACIDSPKSYSLSLCAHTHTIRPESIPWRNDCKLHIHISNDFIGIFDIANHVVRNAFN